jgi:hypothetical protein
MSNNSLLIVTWDEDDSSSGNHIATIFYGPMVVLPHCWMGSMAVWSRVAAVLVDVGGVTVGSLVLAPLTSDRGLRAPAQSIVAVPFQAYADVTVASGTTPIWSGRISPARRARRRSSPATRSAPAAAACPAGANRWSGCAAAPTLPDGLKLALSKRCKSNLRGKRFMAKKLRWGILGVANINNRILPSFLRARNAELRAIASRSVDKARAAAKAAGIPVAHGSYEALLDDPSIDAVYNPLPNTLHDEWTRNAAERGKHIWCEKPLCPTAVEAQPLVEFCKRKGVKLRAPSRVGSK